MERNYPFYGRFAAIIAVCGFVSLVQKSILMRQKIGSKRSGYMTRNEFLKLNLKERQTILSKMNKKQLEKMCKSYGINHHGGAVALQCKLETLR